MNSLIPRLPSSLRREVAQSGDNLPSPPLPLKVLRTPLTLTADNFSVSDPFLFVPDPAKNPDPDARCFLILTGINIILFNMLNSK